MANLARNRPPRDQEFELSHDKVPSAAIHYTVDELPEPPPTRLDIRDGMVKRKGGGFLAPAPAWYNNIDECGNFWRRLYDDGLTFVMGFQCTWLELEKVEDFIIKELFTLTGRTLSHDVAERVLHLESGLVNTSISMHNLVEKIMDKFAFTKAEQIPAHFRFHQILNLITTAKGRIEKQIKFISGKPSRPLYTIFIS